MSCDGRAIAYQVSGEGAPLLFYDFWISNLDRDWDDPGNAHHLGYLSSCGLLIRFDRSGMGLSDRGAPDPGDALDRWTAEAIAVLDDAGIDQVGVAASSWSGALGVALAARHPERVARLALSNPFARLSEAGVDRATLTSMRLDLQARWGSGAIIDLLGIPHDDTDRVRQGRYERGAASPRDLPALIGSFVEFDVGRELAEVRCPTQVVISPSPLVTAAQSALVAEGIPHAETVELDTETWTWPSLVEELPPQLTLAAKFLTGSAVEVPRNTRLVALVFLDVVESTPLVGQMGSRAWHETITLLRSRVDACVDLHRGRLVDAAGDGFFCAFEAVAGALRFARAVVADAREMKLAVRAGVHAGDCELVDDAIRGEAVHAAARIMAAAPPGDVLVSAAVADLASAERLSLSPIGAMRLKGLAGDWELFRLDS